MTEEIVVTGGHHSRRFENLEALRQAVMDEYLEPGVQLDLLAVACIGRLADELNGDTPPALSEVVANIWGVAPSKPEPPDSPAEKAFAERLAELEKQKAEKEAKVEELRATIREREEKYRAEYLRRGQEAERNPTKLMARDRWAEKRQYELDDLRAQRQVAEEAARRARCARNSVRSRRDSWRADRRARFMIDGDVVTLEELHERLDARNNR